MSFVRLDDTHRPDAAEVFLDTSIHCCFHKGIVLGRLKWLLGLFHWRGTSTYSKVEYGNVILAQAQYYLRKLCELGSLKRLHEFVDHVLTPAHHSKKTWAFSLIRAMGTTDRECTRRAKVSLRRLLKMGTSPLDARSDAPLADGTRCHWGRTGLHRNHGGEYVWKTPTCKASNKTCGVDDFFREHRETFEAIKEHVDALDTEMQTDELRQFSQVIARAMEDPSILLEYKSGCRLLADALIAVDSKEYRNFATQNYKESQVLTKVLGQRCYYVPNNPEQGVAMLDHEGRD